MHIVDTYPLLIENNIKFTIWNQSLWKSQEGFAPTAVAIVVKTNIVRTNERIIVALYDNVIFPPRYLPIVSNTLNIKFTVVASHYYFKNLSPLSVKLNPALKNAAGNTINVTVNT